MINTDFHYRTFLHVSKKAYMMKCTKSLFLTVFTIYHHCHAFSSFHGQSLLVTSAASTRTRTRRSRRRRNGDTAHIRMKIRVGTLGLPNVGKSTLFNALARQSIAQAGNFPFCTIDPNITPLTIPDPYLDHLGTLAHSVKTVPATIDWLDVAGLAKGAHRGEGLGNRFLGTLRECHALCHLTRVFEDSNVVHVDGTVDSVGDIEAISLELLFADMAHVERRLQKDKVPEEERAVLEQVAVGLEQGKPARALNLSQDQQFQIRGMGLLTMKPIIHAFNVDECDYVLDRDSTINRIETEILPKLEFFDPTTDLWTLVSAKVEANIATLSTKEQSDYFQSLGVDDFDPALLSYIQMPSLVMQLLDLSVVYTGPGVAPQRSRTTKAHLISGSLTADGLAGRIHGEIEKGFIRAEVISAARLLEHDNYVAAKESGGIRSEGRDYELHNRDVVCIKWK
jgi:GTP-binding protein YchF